MVLSNVPSAVTRLADFYEFDSEHYTLLMRNPGMGSGG
jgi:hypothetical protein